MAEVYGKGVSAALFMVIGKTLIKEDIDKFLGEADQFDDITMLCLEYKMRMES